MSKEKFHFFWKSKLGQWSPSPFIDIEGREYNCAEQYMMAEKARLFGDSEIEEKIMNTNSPKQQKAFGRQVKGFDQQIWDENKEGIVFIGNVYKFQQCHEHYEELMATGDKTLVEASPYDKIWGIGLKADDPKAKNRDLWKGQNLLGNILIEVREFLAPLNLHGKFDE